MGTLYRNGIPYVGSGGAGGVEVTQAEYDALPTSEKMNGSIYFITDGSVSYPTASQMRYDNTESGIPSNSVQGAIDELKIEIGDTDISSIGDGTVTGAVGALNTWLTSLDGKKIRVATHTITTDGSGAAVLPNNYSFSAETGKRMLISVSIANTLKTCSNPGIASGGLPYVHVRNYDGSNCASTQVTLYCYYVQY